MAGTAEHGSGHTGSAQDEKGSGPFLWSTYAPACDRRADGDIPKCVRRPWEERTTGRGADRPAVRGVLRIRQGFVWRVARGTSRGPSGRAATWEGARPRPARGLEAEGGGGLGAARF
jgi:hypothetical protein